MNKFLDLIFEIIEVAQMRPLGQKLRIRTISANMKKKISGLLATHSFKNSNLNLTFFL